MHKLKMLAGLVCSAFFVAGCGGGGDSSAPAEPQSTVDPQGFWVGADFSVLVTQTGELWGIQNTSQGLALITGDVVASANQASGGITFYSGPSAASGTISGVFTERGIAAITSTVTGLGTRTYSAQYSAVYDGVPNVGLLAGAWNLNIGGTMTVNGLGGLSGVSEGCQFTGQTDREPGGKNFYSITITYGAAPCALPGQTVSGVMVLDGASLYGGLLTANKAAGIAITASR